MLYLTDPGIWLSFWLGFVLIGGFGIPVRRVNLYSSSPEGKSHRFRVEGVKFLCGCVILSGVGFSIKFFAVVAGQHGSALVAILRLW